ncbi:hypothetical protein, partial [Escherichia coli]|uniref:hypothetical protein n=1 Tax=Escherichia coli TaxID=562 RepID=UPI001AECADA7
AFGGLAMFFFRPIIFKKITVHKNLRGRSVSGRDGFVPKTTPPPLTASPAIAKTFHDLAVTVG